MKQSKLKHCGEQVAGRVGAAAGTAGARSSTDRVHWCRTNPEHAQPSPESPV